MANFVIPKSSIEGKPAIPGGVYSLRCDGFKPKLSKERNSYNLNPILRVISDDEALAEQVIFYNMNTNFGPGMVDFVHGHGLEMEQVDAGYKIPGKFDGPDDDCSRWVYNGPLVGSVMTAEVIEVPKQVADGTGKYVPATDGSTQNTIKAIICRIPDCQVRHSTNLAGTK